ncbi:MAG TPA: hypothetical protein VHC43_14410 [Mycobacteriales bacterium]|nr:hypothetical protein [Mycobacteriales bacterium]
MARRRLWVLAATALAGLLAVGTADAGTGTGTGSAGGATTTTRTVKVGDDTEAWYQVLPIGICSTPLGCPPPLPLPVPGPDTIYPAGTLHVGAALGVEISRTYLRPALYSLPADATLTDAVATIPIDSDIKAGTIDAGSADIQACLVTAPVTDGVQGSLEDPPAVDCNVKSKVTTTVSGDALTVDLAPLIAAWHAGKPDSGFALVPVLGSLGNLAVWQLALNGRMAGAPHISYEVTYTVPAAPAVTPTSAAPVPVASTAAVGPPQAIPPAVAAVVPPAAPAPVLAEPQPVAQVTSTTGFKYSAVFLMPLAFLFALAFLGRTFTRDATPRGTADGELKRRN